MLRTSVMLALMALLVCSPPARGGKNVWKGYYGNKIGTGQTFTSKASTKIDWIVTVFRTEDDGTPIYLKVVGPDGRELLSSNGIAKSEIFIFEAGKLKADGEYKLTITTYENRPVSGAVHVFTNYEPPGY
jgi:hypothetical protein